MQNRPYILVMGSHKGGTGRTTSALALAYLWGRAGWNVALVDADPAGAARLVAQPPGGVCPWEGVKFYSGLSELKRCQNGNDLILIDSPPLTEKAA